MQTIDTTITIRQSPYFLSVKSLNDRILTFIPSINSQYQPIELLSGYRCGVNISSYYPDEKFYLENNNGNYQLIIKDNLKMEKYGSNCNGCVKIIDLKIKS